MKINARDWMNEEEQQIWDACSTPGVDVNVRVGVKKGLRKKASGDEFLAASKALERIKSVLGRGPIRTLLIRISQFRSHYVDYHLQLNEAIDKLEEVRRTLAELTPNPKVEALTGNIDTFLEELSSEWKAGATLAEGRAKVEADASQEVSL